MINTQDIYAAYVHIKYYPESGINIIRSLLVKSLSFMDHSAYSFLSESEWKTANDLGSFLEIAPNNASRCLKQLVDLDLAERELANGKYRYRRL